MYNVNVTKNVELDQEEASDLVAQVLMEDFDFISREINSTKNLGNLKPYQIEDFRRSVEVRDAMKVLLTYYLTHNDYTEFFELQRVYGNI